MSNKYKHGPWFAVRPENCNGWWVVSTDDQGWDTVDKSGDGGFEEATARLIAAAPELLAALVKMEREKSDYMIRNNLGDPSCETTNKMARAAIAKATGA